MRADPPPALHGLSDTPAASGGTAAVAGSVAAVVVLFGTFAVVCALTVWTGFASVVVLLVVVDRAIYSVAVFRDAAADETAAVETAAVGTVPVGIAAVGTAAVGTAAVGTAAVGTAAAAAAPAPAAPDHYYGCCEPGSGNHSQVNEVVFCCRRLGFSLTHLWCA